MYGYQSPEFPDIKGLEIYCVILNLDQQGFAKAKA